MDCPRCGGRLDRYELADRVEASCVDCGYVGVPVDHESERPGDEPWTDVVERYEQAFEAGDVDTGPAPPSVPEEEGDPEPDTVRTTTAVDLPTGGGGDDTLDETAVDETLPGDDSGATPDEDHDGESADGEATDETDAEDDADASDGDDGDGDSDAPDATDGEPDADATTGDPSEENVDSETTVDSDEEATTVDSDEATEEADDETGQDDDSGEAGTDEEPSPGATDNGTGDGQRAIDEYGENGREAVASPDAGEDGDTAS